MRIPRETVCEIIRFGIVGATATIVQYVLYRLLASALNYNVAYAIAYGISFIGNFFLTSYFTFNSKATAKKGIGFAGAHICNFLIQMLLLNLFVFLGIQKDWAPIPVYAIAIPINFLMVRFVFKHK